MNDLRRQTFGPDLLAHALAHRPGDRSGDRPALHLPDRTVTYADMRDAISQYAQAYTSFGLSQGTAVAVVSSNRAEVLYMVGANSMQGCRPTPLHPMGSLDDHAYVLAHAEIGTLVFDPAFEGRQGARLPPEVGRRGRCAAARAGRQARQGVPARATGEDRADESADRLPTRRHHRARTHRRTNRDVIGPAEETST
jgi:long-subunit acyl-CoA synthetase (AMP-forming)